MWSIRISIVFIIYLLGWVPIFAQNVLETFDLPKTTFPHTISCMDKQGNVIWVNINNDELVVGKVNSKLSVEFVNTYKYTGDAISNFHQAKLTSDNSILFHGNNYNEMVVFKVDSDGNLKWLRRYKATIGGLFSTSLATNSRGYSMFHLATGVGLGSPLISLLVLDKDGNEVNKYRLQLDKGSFYGFQFACTSTNDNFVFTGTGPQDNYDFPGWTMMFGETGNIIWSKLISPTSISTTYKGFYPNSISQGPANRILLGARVGDDQNANNQNPALADGALVLMDNDGNILKAKQIHVEGSLIFSIHDIYFKNGRYYFIATEDYHYNATNSFYCSIDENLENLEMIKLNRGLIRPNLYLGDKSNFIVGTVYDITRTVINPYIASFQNNLDDLCGVTSVQFNLFDLILNEHSHSYSTSEYLSNLPVDGREISSICLKGKENECDINGASKVVSYETGLSVKILNIDSVICNNSQIIDLQNKGIPTGGVFYLNGVQVSSLDPSRLMNSLNNQLVYIFSSDSICKGADTLYFSVRSNSNLTLNIKDVCENVNVNLSLAGDTGSIRNVIFDFDGAVIISGSGKGPYLIKWSSKGIKNVKAEILTDCGIVSLSKKVDVTDVSFSISQDTSINLGSFVQLFANSTNPNLTYKWRPGSFLSCIDCKDPIAKPSRTTKFCVVATDTTTGCASEKCLNIRVGCCR